MTTASDITSLLKRLEKATARLEEVAAGRMNEKRASANRDAPSTSKTGSSDGLSGTAGSDLVQVREYESVVQSNISEFVSLSDQIGGVVAEQAKAISELVAAQRDFIRVAVQTRKPSMEQLQTMLEPQQKAMSEAISIKDSNRPSEFFNHLSTVAEGISAFGWVAVEPTPVPFINEMKDSAQFYGNRVLKEWKEKDEVHAKWVRSFLGSLRELASYVKQHHTTGLSWDPKGVDPEQALQALKGGASASPTASQALPPAPSAGGAVPPPPPPPPPPPMVTDFDDTKGSSSDAPNRGALFADINKGEDITSGLRKVDRSEMTHKNPSLRSSSAIPNKSSAPSKTANKTAPAKAQGPPRTELVGNKWIVENYGEEQITVETTDMKQTVYIYNCMGTTIQVKYKLNSIAIDSCKKTGVVFDSLMSSCEIVNSKSVQVQALETVPTILIDRTDGAHVFLSEEARDKTQITTAKVSEVNVTFPFEPKGPEDDGYVEQPIPEQYQTVVKDGKLITTVVEHSS